MALRFHPSAGNEIAQVDVVGIGKPQQHLRGERPLVALEMIEIARRYAELLGHARLVDAQLAPKHPQPRPEIELAIADLHPVTMS